MSSLARQGDSVSGVCFQPGHGRGNPPQSCSGIITGSSGDTNNVSGVARKGDSVQLYCNRNHTTSISGGSSTVFVNGIPAARVGDAVGNGGDFSGSITGGSSDSNAG